LLNHRAHLPHALLVLAALVVVAAYWSGLNGSFLLDDAANLDSIADWLDGKLGLATLLFERAGGMFGRPVSMASFALNAWLAGYTPFSLKLGNLVVHLLCGFMVFATLRRALRHDPNLQAQAPLYGAVVASLWMLHPLHASTVLYAVQRMAQLSMLLILVGLWLYIVLRERLLRGPSVTASIGLLAGIPAVAVLAFLAKENGALLPLLCAVVELGFFAGSPRPAPVRGFLLLYVVTPLAVGSLAFALQPQRILGGYESRDFTMAERLLTQGRVLCDYIGSLLAPNPPSMGIYTDDFVASASLLSPPTTLAALLFLLATSAAAWHSRKRLPAVAFGWFFFLAAHALEAGPISLELYFEHRNYLPSIGLLTALVALAHEAGRALAHHKLRPGRIGAATLTATLLVLTLGTHGRALVWRDRLLIAESSLATHPQSIRANVEVFSNSIDHGNRKRAEEVVAALANSPIPRNRARAHVYRLFLQCVVDHDADPRDLDAFVTTTPMPLTVEESMPFRGIINAIAQKGCGAVTGPMVGAALTRLADRAHAQSDRVRPKIVLRYYAAEAYILERNWRSALPQANLAWQANTEPALARPLLLAQLSTRDVAGAERTWQEARERAEPFNAADQEALRWMREQINLAKSAFARGLIPSAPPPQ
jgi:protein O-mannosyl-transferase